MPNLAFEPIHNDEHYQEVALDNLDTGFPLRFRAKGNSMRPFIHDGDWLEARPVKPSLMQKGDVVIYKPDNHPYLVHRIIQKVDKASGSWLLVQGDALVQADGWIRVEQVIGKVTSKEHAGCWQQMNSPAIRLQSFLSVSLFIWIKWIFGSLRKISKIIH
jgi:signal peptidase I